MRFFDSNVIYGVHPFKPSQFCVPNIVSLKEHLRDACIDYALVRRYEQLQGGVILGNKQIAEDIKDTENLWGMWSIVPHLTNEIASPADICSEMREKRIAAWQLCPQSHGFPFHYRVLYDYLFLAQAVAIPIFVKVPGEVASVDMLNVLDNFPDLAFIISLSDVWPADRFIRPVLQQFPNCKLEISNYLIDGAIEEIVECFGPTRLIFGSGFAESHFGGQMLAIKHAAIDEASKDLIASGNMLNLIKGIKYDI
ncbi:MAG: hypothetical protein A2Y07_06450 [Planctomycetes bacterium GWF2_50_10]|nr:MAG: hypothetical protein A2Y07_06450 [Planctomycetes bacterium GWF2_50_10]